MKKILPILAFFLIAIAIVPAFLNQSFEISKSIEIKAAKDKVFQSLNDLNEYKKWDPFSAQDPSVHSEVNGYGEGSYMAWKGEKSGAGRMTLSKVIPPEAIEIKLSFVEPFPGEANASWKLISKNSETVNFTWTYRQENSYFKRYFNLIMPAMMGGIMSKGLETFKAQIEAKP